MRFICHGSRRLHGKKDWKAFVESQSLTDLDSEIIFIQKYDVCGAPKPNALAQIKITESVNRRII